MTGYERRDVRFATIAKAFVGLAILVAVVGFMSFITIRFFSSRFPAAVRGLPPPEPRLQADPVEDLRRWRAQEDAELAEYAWIDRSRGVIRLPIERAMALLLRRGLPMRAASARTRP